MAPDRSVMEARTWRKRKDTERARGEREREREIFCCSPFILFHHGLEHGSSRIIQFPPQNRVLLSHTLLFSLREKSALGHFLGYFWVPQKSGLLSGRNHSYGILQNLLFFAVYITSAHSTRVWKKVEAFFLSNHCGVGVKKYRWV